MNTALEEILESPELPDIHAAISKKLADEWKRRERFYEEITPDDKAEFINGEVVMHSPVQVRHLLVSQRLTNLLLNYVDRRGLGRVFVEKALVVTERNDFKPDIVFYGREKARALELDQMKLPPPDFVVEILSSSTERNDRGIKLKAYAHSGVGEYWIIDPTRETIEINLLESQAYRSLGVFGGVAVRSKMIAGFEIPGRALFDDDECRAALDRILLPPAL